MFSLQNSVLLNLRDDLEFVSWFLASIIKLLSVVLRDRITFDWFEILQLKSIESDR